MTDGRNFFDQHMETFKIATGQGVECTTAFSLDYSYFEENYNSRFKKQKALDADLKQHRQRILLKI